MGIKTVHIRNALYIFIILTIFLLQSANLLPLIYGYKYNLLPLVIISLAVLTNINEAVCYAFLISFLCDLNYSLVEGLNTFYFVIATIIIFFIAEKFFTKSFVTNMMFVSITLIFYEILEFILFFTFIDRESALLFPKIACAEILIITILSPVIYFIFNFITKTFKGE